MLIYDADQRYTASQLLRHNVFKELREYEMAQFTAGPSGFARSISRSNLAENLSQYSRRNSDNVSDPGGSSSNIGVTHNSTTIGPSSNVNMNNSISGAGNSGTFGQNSFYGAKKNQPGGPLF